MWKLLRIGAVLALAAVGALKLAQHLAAQSQLERVAAALAPKVRLGYEGVRGALDGRIILESPRLEVVSGPAQGAVLRATRATIEPAGTLWLVWRAMIGESAVPAALGVHLEGASFSQENVDRYAREGWFGASSLVPFESIGCEPVSAFSARDYARMGMTVRPREDELRYSYDPDAHTLRADIVSTAAPFSTVSVHLEMSAFEPSAWLGDARAAKAQRIDQLSLTYLDGGYLARRNRFCAQLTGTDAAGYAARHLAAVEAFLRAHGITPGEDVSALYRKLVAEGGSAEISSLPDAEFVPADFAAYTPDDLLRKLNVTLRRNTAPPILLRLAFTTPSESPMPTLDDTAIASEAPAQAQPPAEPESLESAVAVEAPAPPPMTAHEPARNDGVPLLSVANAAPLPPEKPAIEGEAPRIEVPAAESEVLEVAGAAPEPAPTLPWHAHPSVDPRNTNEAIPPSAPPPPPGSTAALVWGAPTIERLPEKPAAAPKYVTVSPTSLGAHVGARVRLLTAGGKTVEGRLRRLDGNDVVLLVVRDGGSAEMRLPRAGIRGAEVRRAGAR